MKKILFIILILGFYWAINVATSVYQPPINYPCGIAIDKYVQKDTAYFSYYSMRGDTALIQMFRYSDTNRVKRMADTICMIFRDSCNLHPKVLMLDNTNNQNINLPMTSYGRQLYFLKCQ